MPGYEPVNVIEEHPHGTVCDDCWRALQGDRVPQRVTNPPEEICVRCQAPTTSGIRIFVKVRRP